MRVACSDSGGGVGSWASARRLQRLVQEVVARPEAAEQPHLAVFLRLPPLQVDVATLEARPPVPMSRLCAAMPEWLAWQAWQALGSRFFVSRVWTLRSVW